MKEVNTARKPLVQPMLPVKGVVEILADDLPKNLKASIAPSGVGSLAGPNYSVFVDWSGKGKPMQVTAEQFRTSRLAAKLSLTAAEKKLGLPQIQYFDFKGTGVPAILPLKRKPEDVRPIGNPLEERKPEMPFWTEIVRGQRVVFGLTDLNAAKEQYAKAKELRAAGVDAEKPIAVIRYLELLDKHGNTITVEEAKTRGLIPRDFEPAVFVRGLSEADRLTLLARINYFDHPIIDPSRFHEEPVVTYFERHKAQQGWNSFDDYILWLTERVGSNLGKTYKAERQHNLITEHNLLVNGGIADVGTATPRVIPPTNAAYDSRNMNDVNNAIACIHRLAHAVFVLAAPFEKAAGDHLDRVFFDAFLRPKPRLHALELAYLKSRYPAQAGVFEAKNNRSKR